MKKQETFTATRNLSLENSFGTVARKGSVELEVTVGIKEDGNGWFEFYDLETGGEDWYAEGGLWMDGTTVTDYDGVFSLPDFVTAKLREWGYNTEEVATEEVE